MKANGVPLVGTRTAGALLAGTAYVLPDDSLLELAVSDAVIGDDVRLEGSGVQPDVPVPFSLPYADGQDPQLRRGDRGNAARPPARLRVGLAGLSLTSSPSSKALTASTDFLDAAAGLRHWRSTAPRAASRR